MIGKNAAKPVTKRKKARMPVSIKIKSILWDSDDKTQDSYQIKKLSRISHIENGCIICENLSTHIWGL